MLDLSILLNIVAIIFALAGALVVLFKRIPQKIDQVFLVLSGLVLATIAGINLLTHSQIIGEDDILENYLITIIFPISIFLIYSYLVRKELVQRKEVELELRNSTQRLEKMFDAIPILLALFDRSTRQLHVNKEVERKLGYTSEELKVNDIINTFVSDQNDVVRAKEEIKIWNGKWHEYPIKTKSGEVRYQRWMRLPLDDNIIINIGIDLEEQRLLENELSTEQTRFELISKAANDVLYEWDLETGTVWWSQGLETRFGFKKEDIGHDFQWIKSIIHPDDFPELDARYEEIKNSEKNQWQHKYRIIRPDGEIIHVSDRGYFVRNEKGETLQLLGALENISEQMAFERLLIESEEKYRLFFDNSPIGKCIYNPVTLEIIELNKAALSMYEYPPEEIIGESILHFFVPEQQEQALSMIKEYMGQPSPINEWTHRTKTGNLLTVEVNGVQIDYFGNKYRLAVFKDVTQQRLTKERLISSFMEGENKERERLAQDLHDGLGQYLAAANMHLDGLKNNLKGYASEKEIQLYEKGIGFLRQAMTETRTISHNLMPRIVREKGLVDALNILTDSFNKPDHLHISYYHNLTNLKVNDKIAINLYRIAQECLNNIVKHAEATTVNVQLIKDENDLILTIEDNGKGFETSLEVSTDGLGLNSIKTRAFVLGGIFDIDTKRNKGTLITVCVPIEFGKGKYEKNQNTYS